MMPNPGRLIREGYDRGSTLLETLIVLAIIALVAGLAMPNFNSKREISLHTLANELASELRLLRATAIGGSRTTSLEFDSRNNSFLNSETRRTTLIPGTVRATVSAAREYSRRSSHGRIAFFADGSSTGGIVLLEGESTKFRITVNWISGVAELEHGKP